MRGAEAPLNETGRSMANSKSKHLRMKSTRRQKWKARKKRQKTAAKSSSKK